MRKNDFVFERKNFNLKFYLFYNFELFETLLCMLFLQACSITVRDQISLKLISLRKKSIKYCDTCKNTVKKHYFLNIFIFKRSTIYITEYPIPNFMKCTLRIVQ